ncbi:MAG TPA: hypothetical protein VG104_05975 [Candidatus Dormibacteraeota bacterium]|nr:hypothetical protein [Candidatus Dormibacteraeota bacterium]
MGHRFVLLVLLAVAASSCSAPSSTVTTGLSPTSPTSTAVPRSSQRAAQTPSPGPTRLTWQPPPLVNPTTVTLCNCNIIDGSIIVDLRLGQDYILKDPVVLTYPVVIQGGHNIVWIGGEIRPTKGPDIPIQLTREVGYGGGTVHLEGIHLGGVLTDGIEGGEWAGLSKPSGTLADATLQIENVRIDRLSGDSGVTHQDCIQHYGGWKELRVDHFTCQTLYQGFYLPWEDSAENNQGVLLRWDLRNANLRDAPNSTGDGMQTLIHFGDSGEGTFNATSHQQGGSLSNVYLHATQKSLDQETYPNSGTTSSDHTAVHSTVNGKGAIGWASTWAVSGVVIPGDPPGGDYVPLGDAGLNYTSPGYQ